MTDQKKLRNPANALFGLDDVPISTPRGVRPSDPQRSTGQATQGAAGGYSFGRPATSDADQGTPETAKQQQVSAPQPLAEDYPQGPSQGATSSAPQYIYVQAPPSAATSTPAVVPDRKWLWALVIILLAASAANLYLVLTARNQFSSVLSKQADQLNVLTRRADSSDERYAELGAKFAVTAERLGMTRTELARARQLAVNIERQQQQSVKSLDAAIAEKASAHDLNNLQSQANTKFGTLTGNLLGTQKDLDATKEALTGAKTELTGAIAHTHDELIALAHRTDRDYFEFRLNSKGSRQKIGGVQLQLVKTNTKMNLFTVNLFFDDKRTQRKNESVDEPVFFYMQGSPNALELVVNHVTKNAITGYISAPKGFIVSGANVLTSRPTA